MRRVPLTYTSIAQLIILGLAVGAAQSVQVIVLVDCTIGQASAGLSAQNSAGQISVGDGLLGADVVPVVHIIAIAILLGSGLDLKDLLGLGASSCC